METTKENRLGVLPVEQLIRQFAVPSIIAMLVGALYNIVDQFFIGRSIGELGNAATNVAFPLTTSCVAVALLFGIGGASSFNLALGRKQKEQAVHYMGNAAVLLFVLGIVLCLVAQIFLVPMLKFFGSPDRVLAYAITYTRITSLGFPFFIYSNGGAHLVRADGTPKYSMLCNLTGALINTILDPIFIFCFGMGMAGAALATIIGQIVAAGMIFQYMLHCKSVTLKPCHLVIRAEYAVHIMSLGLSSFFNQIAMMVVQIVLNNSLTYYGARSVYGDSIPLACAGIISKVAMLYFSIVIGLAQGLQPIAGYNYGAEKYDRVKAVYFRTVRYALTVSSVAFFLFQLFPRQIISVFGDGSEEYFLFAVRYFQIFMFMTFLNGIQPVTATFFTATGKPVKGIFLSLTRQILFLLPLIVVFPIFLGIDGIMYAGPIADLAAGAAAIGMIAYEMRQITRMQKEGSAAKAQAAKRRPAQSWILIAPSEENTVVWSLWDAYPPAFAPWAGVGGGIADEDSGLRGKERFPVWPCGTGAGSFGVYREDRLEKYKVLKEYFGYDGFRPGQEALIDGILGGQDVLGIMPTGAGKSICYQVPALLLSGITIVISPLISLMKDQVRGLNEAGIHAAYINSSLTEGQIRKAMELAGQGRYKIIYVAPERLLSGLFQEFLSRAEISMVTVDEAHCISQWGQDFRPSYLNIVHMIAGMKRRPVVSAFTATATEEVKNDILCVLGLQNPRVLVTGFDRENLYFEVRSGGQKDQELLQYVQEHRKESGIIYCATRKNVEAVCELLKKTGIPAVRYHAGLSPQERKYNQDLFIFDEQPVMVATNAFGMGIDKSNVRYVIHYNMPQSMENYYQEAGRAGRDGERAECILLYSPQDVRINQFLLEEKEFREEMTKEEQEAVRERDAQRLKLMAFYCTTRDCLRGYILRYFGEKTKRRCENCSNCLKEYTEEDVTNICKSILSCIREARRSYGAGTIAAVLHGSKSEKIRGYGLDRLTSYGTQAEVAEYRLREIIGELTARGVLRSTDDKYATLRLTQAAEKILEGQEAVVMKFSRAEEKKAPAQKKKKQTSGDLDAAGWQLFERLRELRMQIARAEKVPPYIVFTDKTLMDMCLKKPKNRAEMLSVSGVGAAKYEKYGEQFLAGIRGR